MDEPRILSPSPYGHEQMPMGQPHAPAPQRKPDRWDTVTAILSVIAGFLYVHAMFRPDQPYQALGLTVLFYGIAALWLGVRGARVPKAAFWLPASCALFSLSYLLHDHALIHFAAFQWAKLSCLWFSAIAMGTLERALPGEYFLGDVIQSVLVQPFSRFGALFPALFSGNSITGKKSVGWVFLGLAVAIVPCIAVANLLSFDAGFAGQLERIFSGEWITTLFKEGLYLAAALPVAMYFFSALSANFEGRNRDLSPDKAYQAKKNSLSGAPAAFGAAVLLPVLGMYAIFFSSQWEQYLYAFLFRLPSAFESFSQYARDGFFQLCLVAGINAALMLLARSFVKRRPDGQESPIMRGLYAVYSVVTLGLLATALAKMMLYVEIYGFTPLRVYTSWLMIAIMFDFLAVLISVFVRRLRLVPTIFAIGLLFFGAACVHDTHAWIARSNIEAYVSGEKETLDVGAMYELNLGAVQSVYESIHSGKIDEKSQYYGEIHEYLCNAAWEAEQEKVSVFAMTPVRIRTQRLLTQYREQYPEIYREFAAEYKRIYEDWEYPQGEMAEVTSDPIQGGKNGTVD